MKADQEENARARAKTAFEQAEAESQKVYQKSEQSSAKDIKALKAAAAKKEAQAVDLVISHLY